MAAPSGHTQSQASHFRLNCWNTSQESKGYIERVRLFVWAYKKRFRYSTRLAFTKLRSGYHTQGTSAWFWQSTHIPASWDTGCQPLQSKGIKTGSIIKIIIISPTDRYTSTLPLPTRRHPQSIMNKKAYFVFPFHNAVLSVSPVQAGP